MKTLAGVGLGSAGEAAINLDFHFHDSDRLQSGQPVTAAGAAEEN